MASLSFAALDAALDAGWYLFWRLFLWVLCGSLCVVVIARSGLAQGDAAYVLTHFTVVLGYLAGLVPWLLRLNRVVDAWTRARHGRHLTESIRWSIVWRAGLATFGVFAVAGIFMALAEDVAGARPAVMRVVTFVLLIGTLIAMIIGVGWAMLAAVAKQLRRPASKPAR